MTKYITFWLMVFALTCVGLGVNGCSEDETSSTQSTSEKLGSDDPSEREQGINEAEDKYGDNDQ